MKQETKDVAKLLGKIDFSPDNVVQAAAENSSLFVEAIQFRLEKLSARNAAKMAWEEKQAARELNIRKVYREAGEKITEGNIDALLLTDINIKAAAEAYSRAEELDEYSKLVCEAFRMRRDCLEVVGNLMRNELSMQAAVEQGRDKMAAARKVLRERFSGE